MTDLLNRIFALVEKGDIRISEHGYDQLSEDGLLVRDVLNGFKQASVIEEHPDYPKGPCILLLQHTADGKPVHALWGIPKSFDSPAILITAYRPDPARWTSDFLRRLS
jgi:hypothetical protein